MDWYSFSLWNICVWMLWNCIYILKMLTWNYEGEQNGHQIKHIFLCERVLSLSQRKSIYRRDSNETRIIIQQFSGKIYISQYQTFSFAQMHGDIYLYEIHFIGMHAFSWNWMLLYCGYETCIYYGELCLNSTNVPYSIAFNILVYLYALSLKYNDNKYFVDFSLPFSLSLMLNSIFSDVHQLLYLLS